MSIVHADRRRDVPRKEAMMARRIRQRTRKAGFTPVPNARIEKQFGSLTTLLTAAYIERKDKDGTAIPNAAAIEREAWNTVRQGLPQLPIGTRVRPHVNTSKYNQENTKGNR